MKANITKIQFTEQECDFLRKMAKEKIRERKEERKGFLKEQAIYNKENPNENLSTNIELNESIETLNELSELTDKIMFSDANEMLLKKTKFLWFQMIWYMKEIQDSDMRKNKTLKISICNKMEKTILMNREAQKFLNEIEKIMKKHEINQ